jgi:hypothetical protein
MVGESTPKTPSPDYEAMSGFWQMTSAILKGAPGLRVEAYLPKFPKEPDDVYKLRRTNAPLTNLYDDISRNLASRPFAKPVEISEKAPEVIGGTIDADTKTRSGGLVANIDGQGNSLHVFAATSFKAGIDKGLDWILVDHTRAVPRADGRTLSKADEQEQGLRPYWVHIPAERMLAVFSDFVSGVETIIYARIYEPCVERAGYGTVTKERVREISRDPIAQGPAGVTAYGPAHWTLLEEQTDAQGKKSWVEIDAGDYSIGVIPIVPFIPGKRHGSSFVVDPPLRNIAFMQIEEFQQESNLKEVSTMTAFPMLAAIGVTLAPGETFQVGPRSLLTAPATGDGSTGDFKYVEPEATSLTFLETRLANFRQEMRDLGMQPLQAANLTVITTANASQKASSAAQAWAILFKDTLDRCLSLTALWLGIKDIVTAKVHTDFAVETSGDLDMGELLKSVVAEKISIETYWSEMQRRGKLGPEFDHETETARLKTMIDAKRAQQAEDMKAQAALKAADPNKQPAPAA